MPSVQYIDADVEFTVEEPPSTDAPTDEVQNGTLVRELQTRADDQQAALEGALERIRKRDVFPIVEAEIIRTAGMGGGEATFKTWMKDPTGLEYAVAPYAEVRAEISINGEQVFAGTITKIKHNEEGIITFLAQDARYQFNHYSVRLDTRGKGAPSTKIVRNLLVTEGPFDSTDLHIDAGSPVSIKESFGANTRVPLREVLKVVARREHAYVYVDADNEIHYADMPPRSRIDVTPDNIISVNAGNSSTPNETVVAQAPGVDKGGGFSFFGHGHMSSGNTKATAHKGKESDKATLLKDPNLKSTKQASASAVDTMVGQDMLQDHGKVELVGAQVVTPWDTLVLKEMPPYAALAAGTYTVREVTHKLSVDNGYTTTCKLGKNIEHVYEMITDTSGLAADRQQKSEDTDGLFPLPIGGSRIIF